ncbi:integral membrane protein [Apiospora arundinis]|uniref:Integral membrane protein n=1 Tax=Apiospora arundinis TaxID=335852 RepID=A0ABR2J4H9_9PEZI
MSHSRVTGRNYVFIFFNATLSQDSGSPGPVPNAYPDYLDVGLPYLPGYSNAAGNIVTDILILLLPLPMIRALNLPRAQKLGLIGIFCLGFLTCAISLVRVRYLPQGVDFTWDNVDTMFWSMAEACTGLICVTLPTLRPLAIRCFPGVFKPSSTMTRSNSKLPGAPHWRPRNVETGRKIRSTATNTATTITTNNRWSTKQWTNNTNTDGGDQETLVNARPGSKACENRDPGDDEQQTAAAASKSAATTRSRHMTYLEMSSSSSSLSLEGGDIELRDIGSQGGRRNMHLSHPMPVYDSGGKARTQNIGNTVEISSLGRSSRPLVVKSVGSALSGSRAK